MPVGEAGGILAVRILNAAGETTPARVNVVGSDHAYYEPAAADNALHDWSLKRIGFRINRGPLRYYGSFFYTEGAFQVRLPPGPVRVEVRKGFDHHPATVETMIVKGRQTDLDVSLRPLVDMAKAGWFATDTHLHFNRPNVTDLTLVTWRSTGHSQGSRRWRALREEFKRWRRSPSL
jgi:hypothetical protein